MNIGLISIIPDNMCPNLSILSLSALLKTENHITGIFCIRLDKEFDRNKFKKFVSNKDVIGISVLTFSWSFVILLIKEIRLLGFKKKIILGGVHPTYSPSHVLAVSDADIVVCGEAELVIIPLMRAINEQTDLSKVLGITYKDRNKKLISSPHPEILSQAEYDSQNIADYDLFFLEKERYEYLPYETSRGCKFNCLFCSIPFKKNWRFRGADTVVEHLNIIKEKYSMKINQFIKSGIFFVDDCFTANAHRATRIFKLMTKSNYDIPYSIEARITDLLDDTLLENMTKTCINKIQVGIECGYDDGLKIINKGLSTQKIIECAKKMKKFNLNNNMFWSFIIGFPWETKKEMTQTISFAGHLATEFGGRVNINWYNLLPSRLWEQREKYNISLDISVFDLLNTPEALKNYFHSYMKKENIQFFSEACEIIEDFRNSGLNFLPLKNIFL